MPLRSLPITNTTSLPHSRWRESRDERLRHQDDEEAEKTKQTRAGARQYIDDFYENYNAKKEKQITRTRKEAEEFLEKREDTSSGGTSWERIAKLVDLSGKGAKGELCPLFIPFCV